MDVLIFKETDETTYSSELSWTYTETIYLSGLQIGTSHLCCVTCLSPT